MINQNIIFKKIEAQALKDNNIYIVCGDGLDIAFFPELKKRAPERVIACGISEQNQISVSNGIALGGKKVYCLMMNAFLVHRALDQLKMACYSNADIKFLGFTPGIVPMAGGYSHISIDDFAILKNTPNLEIYEPYTKEEIENVVQKTFQYNTPMYISCVLESIDYLNQRPLRKNVGFSKLISGSKDLCIISSGDAITYLFNNYDKIIQKITNKCCLPTCYSVYKINPIDNASMMRILSKYKNIMTFECRGAGGLSQSIAEAIASQNKKVKLLPIYFKNEKYNFVGYGDYAVRKCLKISELDKLVKSYFGIKKFKLFKPKCKQNENGIIIKHKFCGFTYKKEYV